MYNFVLWISKYSKITSKYEPLIFWSVFEKKKIADVNGLRDEFESDNTVSSADYESTDFNEPNENDITFGLELDDTFEDWDFAMHANIMQKKGWYIKPSRTWKCKNILSMEG